jgi:hypothetical protein
LFAFLRRVLLSLLGYDYCRYWEPLLKTGIAAI